MATIPADVRTLIERLREATELMRNSKMLRAAFMATATDPKFLADAERQKFDVVPENVSDSYGGSSNSGAPT